MTLRDAVRALATTASIMGLSNQELVIDVDMRQRKLEAAQPGLPTKSTLATAEGVNGPLNLRPISALLELARATALSDDPDIATAARRWAVLRYLGIFRRSSLTGALNLDDTALQFIGPNQRRVLSEELGIGFGIMVAKVWCRARNPAIGPITTIDVDKALYSSAAPNLERNGKRQPDYLLSYPSPTNPSLIVFELLETKGTVSTPNAKEQLGRAVTQLAGLTVNGRAITGLATSTVSNATAVTVMAVDPEESPITWEPSNAKLQYWRTGYEKPRKLDYPLDVNADEFFATAMNVDMASLAEFSGQHDAVTKWLPSVANRRSTRRNTNARRESEHGVFVGSEVVIEASGASQRLRIFQGVEEHVAEELRAIDAIAVREAQRSFASFESESITDAHSTANHDEHDAAVALSSDGAMLEIRVD